MIDIKLEGEAEVNRRLSQMTGTLQFRATAMLAQSVFDDVQKAADVHTKTGALFRSVQLNRLGPASYEIKHNLQVAPYAPYVHWGTRPHEIRPRIKKALRFVIGNHFIFAKRVRHPGYAGDPYMVRIAAEMPAKLDVIVRKLEP